MRRVLAEKEGFEPSIPFGMAEYQSAAFGRSATSVDAPFGRIDTNDQLLCILSFEIVPRGKRNGPRLPNFIS
jgi:hypothetical protein